MTADSLLVLLLVGLVAGFLASHVLTGHGYGLVGDLVVGIVGALIGGFLAGALGITATGLVAEILIAFAGAIILLVLLRAFSRSRRRVF